MEYKFTKQLTPGLMEKWNLFVAGQKTGSLFQMPLWMDLFDPKTHNWFFFMGEEGDRIRIAALIRGRKIPGLGLDCFIDRGPVYDDETLLAEGLKRILLFLRKERAIRLRVNPYWEFPAGERVESTLKELGFESDQRKQDSHFESLTIDLRKEAEEIFKNFRKDTRWRIKNSKKMGVSVKSAQSEEDLKAFYHLMVKMSKKKGMKIQTYFFFLTLWKKALRGQSHGVLLLSSYQDRLLSGVIITIHGQRAVYSWGASETEHQDKVSKNHLALWKGILWAKEKGCTIFDMGGFAGTQGMNTELESIDAFKKGFGGQYCRMVKIHLYVFRKQREKWVRFLFPER